MPSSDFYIGSEFQDFYQILGVSKDATIDEIKKVYKKKALEFHPDKNPQPSAAEIFKKISSAYEVLSDSDLRKEYDLVLEEKLAQAKYFSGQSQSTQQPRNQSNRRQYYYQYTQPQSGYQSNQWQSGSQYNQQKYSDQYNQWQSYYKSKQSQSGDKFNQNQYGYRHNQHQFHDRFNQEQYDYQHAQNEHNQNQSYYSSAKTNEFRKKIYEYEDEIRKIKNHIYNLRNAQQQLLRLQQQTKTQLYIAEHQNNWEEVLNCLKKLMDFQQQEQTTALKILRSQQDLVKLETEEYTLAQTFFSEHEFKSLYKAKLYICQQKLRSLQIQASEIEQELEIQQRTNANNNQDMQTKISYTEILVEMQASVISIEDKIAVTVQQKNTAMHAERKSKQDRMRAQENARQYWDQGDISKAITAERDSVQLFVDENQQLLNQATADLKEAELQQEKLKCLAEIAKYKNLLSPSSVLKNEYENKKILVRMWQERVKQYNNKVAMQQIEYNASVAIKAKIGLIEDLQKTRIAIKKSQEQLLMNSNFLGENESSSRNKAFQDYQILLQWLERTYLNKNFWSKSYDEIKDALEEIKDSANNIQKQKEEALAKAAAAKAAEEAAAKLIDAEQAARAGEKISEQQSWREIEALAKAAAAKAAEQAATKLIDAEQAARVGKETAEQQSWQQIEALAKAAAAKAAEQAAAKLIDAEQAARVDKYMEYLTFRNRSAEKKEKQSNPLVNLSKRIKRFADQPEFNKEKEENFRSKIEKAKAAEKASDNLGEFGKFKYKYIGDIAANNNHQEDADIDEKIVQAKKDLYAIKKDLYNGVNIRSGVNMDPNYEPQTSSESSSSNGSMKILHLQITNQPIKDPVTGQHLQLAGKPVEQPPKTLNCTIEEKQHTADTSSKIIMKTNPSTDLVNMDDILIKKMLTIMAETCILKGLNTLTAEGLYDKQGNGLLGDKTNKIIKMLEEICKVSGLTLKIKNFRKIADIPGKNPNAMPHR